MGRYEPPKHKQEPRRNLGKLFSTVAFLSIGSIGIIRGLPQEYTSLRPDLEAIVEAAAMPDAMPAGAELTIYAPMIAATETAQGTRPFADGNYIQLSTIRSDRVPTVLSNLESAKLDVIAEDIPGGRTRLLVKYDEGEQHGIVKRFKSLYPDSNPMILTKADGRDKFSAYEPPRIKAASLEEYCKAANGDISNMPFYEQVSKEARRAVEEGSAARFGYDEHKYQLRLFAIMYTESSFRPDAESGVGAKGLMQVMPDTAEWLGGDIADLMNPEENIRLGSKAYQSFLQFAKNEMRIKNPSEIRRTAIKAYNGGPGTVKQHMRGYRRLAPETVQYVKKVEANERILSKYFPR